MTEADIAEMRRRIESEIRTEIAKQTAIAAAALAAARTGDDSKSPLATVEVKVPDMAAFDAAGDKRDDSGESDDILSTTMVKVRRKQPGATTSRPAPSTTRTWPPRARRSTRRRWWLSVAESVRRPAPRASTSTVRTG